MLNINVDPKKELGAVKPLHGINNGPISLAGVHNTEKEYAEMGIPFVRLHDTDYPYPQAVDVYQIFRDFSADPNDPKNYDFCLTDQYIAAIIRTGASVIYRLGTSIEHMEKKRFIAPPGDYDKFAAVCCGIVRHYNEGFADGYHYGIRCWEIWNEPESDLMWSGTTEQYFLLYETVSKALKKEFGDTISVGGYASCGFYGIEKKEEERTVFQKKFIAYLSEFIDFVKKTDSPFEFYSFHYYGIGVREIQSHARYVRKKLDAGGYGVPILLDEWNTDDLDRITTMRSARHVLSMMAAFADSPIDAASYYDGQPHMRWCGIFDRCARKQKPFYAFCLYNKLYRLGTRLVAESDGLPCMAARNEKTVGVLIVGTEEERAVSLAGLNAANASALLLDETHDLSAHSVENQNGKIVFSLPAGAVVYVEAQTE